MMPKPQPSARKGFTLIEVMVALAVMTVGVMGTLALQRQVVVSNRHARRVDIATQIAENWLERLRIDSTQWPKILNGNVAAANGRPTGVAVLNNTEWLRSIVGNVNTWMPIRIRVATAPGNGSGPNISNAFNFQGQDVQVGAAPHSYCASFRLTWTRFTGVGNDSPQGMRADVRVWWPRELSGIGPTTAPFATCADAGGNITDGPYHAVYASTVMAPR